MQESLLHHAAELMILLSVILVAAKLGGEVATRYLKIPSVLGELIAGILISPHLLGGMEFFGFSLMATGAGESVAEIPHEIRYLAQIAAIILLFEAGLETNRRQFVQYLKPALAVALGGVALPFALGVMCTVWLGYASFDSAISLAPALFVGAILSATSVGITARVLSDIRRLDTGEGVTVMAGAVVDDVLGIILLAVVVGIHAEGAVAASTISFIFLKAAGFWLGLTILGSILAKYISAFTMWFRSDGGNFAVAAGLALLAAGIAEAYFGLAMIIGAYSMGLALSGTDLQHRIATPMRHAGQLLVPVFFTFIGMEVDLGSMFGSDQVTQLMIFAFVLTLAAIVSKLVGSGLPALLVGFDRMGAWRIGLGMLPRGEVALIVAGIGLDSGVIGEDIFGVAIIMTVATTVIAPMFLTRAFKDAKTFVSEPSH